MLPPSPPEAMGINGGGREGCGVSSGGDRGSHGDE